MKNLNYSRRDFIRLSALGTAAGMTMPLSSNSFRSPMGSVNDKLKVFVFSKHLQFLDYQDMCEAAKEMGFDGIDLTVRPKGHVLTENVEHDLPKAKEAMKSFDLYPQLITTKVADANDSKDRKILEVAAKLGFQYYRPAWYRYSDEIKISKTLEKSQKLLNGLAELNKELGIIGSYHNHSGNFVGSAVWDLHQVLNGISSEFMGCQYDIMHATVEGGKNWEYGFRRIKEYINTIVVKDFRWKKSDGKWRVEFCPLGEGMVDFKKFFSLLKKYNINVPVSIHYEYDLGGAEHGGKPSIPGAEVLKRIKKDLEFIHQTWNK